MTLPGTVIATWFVADSPEEGTFFPQLGTTSDAPEAQAAYWRCMTCFFASSLAVNPGARHIAYTNTVVPRVDGIDIAALLAGWGVEVQALPIGWRLPRGAVSAWGNQFYVFDVIRHFVQARPADRLILLDSDCVWLRGADAIERAIDQHGALTYLLGEDEYPAASEINGLSRQSMARFLEANGGPSRTEIPYFGGEIYAANLATSAQVIEIAERLWPQVQAHAPDAPREEAHLLSVIYAQLGIPGGTADPFIRRMWTTFNHHNLQASDRDLTIWHLPAEKRTGFRDLFSQITQSADMRTALTPAAFGHHMGYPRRRPAKLARDLSLKVAEKLGL